MPYAVSGTDVRGVNTVNRKTPELALRKARELIQRGCYNVQIKTPAGPTIRPNSRIFPERPSRTGRLQNPPAAPRLPDPDRARKRGSSYLPARPRRPILRSRCQTSTSQPSTN